MKVTFCAYDFVEKVGGPVSWLKRLVPTLRGAGLEVHVLLLSDCADASPLGAEFEAIGVQISTRPAKGSTESKVSWVLQEIERVQPDVFVANLCVPALYAAGWVRAAGIPTLGVLHSDDPFYRAVQQEFIFGDPFYALSAVVCVSRFLEESINERDPPLTRVFRAPYGVPVPEDCAISPGEHLRMIYVGRLVEPQKRIYRVVRAMCAAARKLSGVTGSIVGSGRKRDGVANILAQECPQGTVRLVGKVPLEDMSETLLSHHVFVLLSDYEGLPIALMEAMACGLVPVVSRMRSGVPELIEHGETGLIVDGDVDSFVAAVTRLRDEPEHWQTLSRKARERIETEYSEAASGKTWIAILERLAGERGSKSAIRIPDAVKLPRRKRVFAQEDVRDRLTMIESIEATFHCAYEAAKRLLR